MERKKVVEELHAPARRNYMHRKFLIRGIDETWQADLVIMDAYSNENKGYKYLLTVIDTFSKYAWAVPVKSKSGDDVTKAMLSIFKQNRVCKNLQVDNGTEFYNSNFLSLMQLYKVHLYSTYSNLKASICERFNRTLKNKMWKQFSLQGNYKWLEILPNLVKEYNNTVHRTIKMKPKDVTSDDEATIFQKFLREYSKVKRKKPKFKVDDKVRVSRVKHIFEKSYTPNWTTEVFTIVRVARTKPITYRLVDYKNEPIAGGFYEEELSKVKYPDVFLVEKVIKRRGNQLFVKWLGFDNAHNSWINKNTL